MRSHLALGLVPAFALGVSEFVAQSTPLASAAPTSSPVARIYVTQSARAINPNSPYGYQFVGYSADSEGRLTPIAGGPWPGMAWATTGTWLFADDAKNIRYALSYKVDSAGAPHQAAQYDLANRAPAGCAKVEGFDFLTLDHTGATLYAHGASYSQGSNGCADNAVLQSYKINKETGTLTYLGSIDDPILDSLSGLTFTDNNLLAFGGEGGGGGATCDCRMSSFIRQSDGLLVKGATTVLDPAGSPSGQRYYPFVKADPSGHLAVWLDPQSEAGNQVLGAYTVHSDGTITTNNTYDQMPVTGSTAPPDIGSGFFDISMSPSGKLLAVVMGDGSLHLFHFNGASPITSYTTLLPVSADPEYTAWDSANHLYVVTSSRLYVFTVTPTSHAQAPGSPYSISYGNNILVHSIQE